MHDTYLLTYLNRITAWKLEQKSLSQKSVADDNVWNDVVYGLSEFKSIVIECTKWQIGSSNLATMT